MLKMELTSELMTGIRDIDDQHRSLIAWANAVFSLGDAESERDLAIRTARFLFAYAEYHFSAEEYAMIATAYPGLDPHRREHLELRSRLAALRKAVKSGATFDAMADSLRVLLEDWLLRHIRHTDRAFARHCSQDPGARVLSLPSPEELRGSGLSLADYQDVEFVHAAGEISPAEVKARLSGRWPRG